MRIAFAFVLGLGGIAVAQQLELPVVDAQLDAVARATDAAAHLVVVVDRRGRTYQRGAGFADAAMQRPFETWMPVPLGRLSRVVAIAGFEAMARDGKIGWDDPVGGAVPGLPEDLAQFTWRRMLSRDASVPCFSHFVGEDATPRSLAEVIAAHAFAIGAGSAWSQDESMTPWALMQSALERSAGTTWGRAVRSIAKDELGMRGLRDERGTPTHMLVARHRADAVAIERRLPEVAAAAGAIAPAADLARLLTLLLDEKRRATLLVGVGDTADVQGDGDGRTVPIALPGVSGSLRVHPDAGVAAFVFVAREDPAVIEQLHANVLQDLGIHDNVRELEEPILEPEIEDIEEGASTAIDGVWRGSLDRAGQPIPIEILLDTESDVMIRIAEGELRRAPDVVHGAGVNGWFTAVDLAPSGGRQWTMLSLSLDGDALAGWAMLMSQAAGETRMESLPCRLRLSRVVR